MLMCCNFSKRGISYYFVSFQQSDTKFYPNLKMYNYIHKGGFPITR